MKRLTAGMLFLLSAAALAGPASADWGMPHPVHVGSAGCCGGVVGHGGHTALARFVDNIRNCQGRAFTPPPCCPKGCRCHGCRLRKARRCGVGGCDCCPTCVTGCGAEGVVVGPVADVVPGLPAGSLVQPLPVGPAPGVTQSLPSVPANLAVQPVPAVPSAQPVPVVPGNHAGATGLVVPAPLPSGDVGVFVPAQPAPNQ